jgi:DNA polymerase III subunit epsilon
VRLARGISMPDLANDYEAMASALEQSGEYRVLRRLVPRPLSKQPPEGSKIAILLDFETTGLNTLSDEVIELGMVKFCYSEAGEVTTVVDAFSSFNQPSNPIPPEVVDLTGITDEMVSGQQIDPDAVGSFVTDANVVIAHNANFDRKFAERGWPIFIEKNWACSAQEVEWRKHGFDGSRLAYLLSGAGFFHEAHRAVDDCQAQLEILARPLPNTDRTALSVMLERARRPTFRIWAENSPFDLKEHLKRRGYRWNDGSDGRPRSWFVDVSEGARDEEIRFLKEAIYQREVDFNAQRITATNRFSIRA